MFNTAEPQRSNRLTSSRTDIECNWHIRLVPATTACISNCSIVSKQSYVYVVLMIYRSHSWSQFFRTSLSACIYFYCTESFDSRESIDFRESFKELGIILSSLRYEIIHFGTGTSLVINGVLVDMNWGTRNVLSRWISSKLWTASPYLPAGADPRAGEEESGKSPSQMFK